MNKKTFIIIGLIFCLLFTMPMASAAENSADSSSLDDNFAIESDIYQLASADVDGFDIADENVSDDSVASISDSEEIADGPGGDINKNYNENNKNFGASILAADGSGNTFSDLKSIIENAIANGDDSVALDRDFEFTSGEDDSLTDGIVINSPITIIGGSHTIDAKNMARIFTISSNNVFLKDIVFKNANASNSNSHGAAGGAVYVETAGSAEEHSGISNSTFINCYSTGDGGALYVKSDYFTLSDSIFTDNTAGDDGGAIDWEGDYGEISNLTASGNSAISYGTSNSKGGTIIITGSCMKMDQLNITNSIAKADSGHNLIQGGAIFLTGNYCNITNSRFENCSVDFDGDDASGGALYVIGNFTNIIGADFINNSATEDGGAVFIHGNDCTLNNTLFTGNIAHNDGGAIEWDGDNGMIYNLTADENHGDSAHGSSKGGTIIATGDRIVMDMLNITNSHVNGPTYTGTNTIQGGAIFLTGNECNITNSRFENCFADHSKVEASGGALYILGNKSSISNVEISNASSKKDGSAVYVFGNNGNLEKVSISNSKSSSGDGTIMISGNNTLIDSCSVDSSYAKNAGALKIAGDGTKVSNSNFTNNNASAMAGAIEVLGSDTTITGCNISDNTAATNGGGVYYKGSRFTLQDSNIDHNSAKVGASIYLDKGSISSHIIGCNITNAYANGGNSGFGGGVEWLENSVDGLIKDCYFYNLSSSSHGGAIHWYPGTNGQVDNCTFIECHVDDTKNAGAIYAGANTNVIPKGTILSNSTFINCTSGTRGAVNWNSVGGLIINNTFINCGGNSSATTQYGGRQAMQIEKGNNTQILLCEFYNCTGIGGGGALRIQDQGENITIANCTFDGCSNTGTAGAVYISNNGKNIVFENNSFTNNSAPNTGALYADSRTTFSSFANNTFISNKATDASGNAGAVRFSGEAAIADSRFIDNSCNGAGGAIFANGKLNISGSTFENNTAGTNGGAISSNNGNGNLFVNESSFKYNKAPTGSAIRARSVNIENTELLENQALFDKWNNQRHSFTENHVSINGTFVGRDNYLNAINAGSGTFSNVVYCGVNGGGVDEGTTNTDDVTSAKSFNEVHQIVILEIFDENNNLVESIKQYTDASGNYNFEVDLSSDAQSYSYRISHPEDNYYTYAEYTLHKDSSVLNISCQNITYPEDENITFEVSGIDGMTPTGNITVVINDTNGVIIYNDTIQLSSGKAKLDFSKLNASEYYIHARYNGDENYLPDNETAVFHVNQTKPSMDLETITPVSYGDNETLVVTVIPVVGGIVPTGNVTVVITDSEGNVVVTFNEKALTDGSVEINVTGLAVGEYNVNATYNGDENYISSDISGSFEVVQATPEVNIGTANITYGENETVVVAVEAVEGGDVPTGNVTVVVTDSEGDVVVTFTEEALTDGAFSFNLTGLAVGEYGVDVTYNGDVNYTDASGKANFTVERASPDIEIGTENIVYDQDETISVTVSPVEGGTVPTGTVNITVTDEDGNSRTFNDVSLENGAAEKVISDLDAGNYTVQIVYSGDDNYAPDTKDGKFEVAKADAIVEIHVYDIIYGDIEELTVTCNAPGNVTVYVNGINVTLSLDDGYEHRLFASLAAAYSGNARLDLENLAAGTYPASVHYNGDKNHNEADDDDTFHVIPQNTTVSVYVDDIKVGEDAIIKVELSPEAAPGNITVTIDGRDYNVELTNGKGQLAVPGFKAGEHDVVAKYPGSQNYTNSSNSTTFKVTRNTPEVSIDSQDINVGDMETITVTVPKDATGNVTITVAGKTYTAPVKDGKAVFNVPGLKAGNYAVDARYNGDDKYDSLDVNGTFTVSKVKPDMGISAATIKVGDDGTVTVTVPKDATGKITIEVAGKKYTALIKDGKAVFNVPGLKVGIHHIKAYYEGDEKYESSQADGYIEVVDDNHNGSHNKAHEDGIDLASIYTGNPVMVLILVLSFLGLLPLGRKRDDDE
ncbi:MAG: Ig-like domain repeat protein [Methanobrevibacter sp.]|nr:Ig-like domain repeat protein [Methanobrevibacter sp.]